MFGLNEWVSAWRNSRAAHLETASYHSTKVQIQAKPTQSQGNAMFVGEGRVRDHARAYLPLVGTERAHNVDENSVKNRAAHLELAGGGGGFGAIGCKTGFRLRLWF